MAELSKAGNLVALEVDLEAEDTRRPFLLAPLAQDHLRQVDPVDSVVASEVASMAAVAAEASEAASKTEVVTAADVAASDTKEAEDSNLEAATVVVVEIAAVGVAEEIVAVMHHQTHLLDLEDHEGVDTALVDTAVEAMVDQGLRIATAQDQLLHQLPLAVGMTHVEAVAHMTIDLAVTVAAVVAAMEIVVGILEEAVAATWSR